MQCCSEIWFTVSYLLHLLVPQSWELADSTELGPIPSRQWQEDEGNVPKKYGTNKFKTF